jgi:putative spermidine/putrescine transport system ATP-binding protein
LIGTIVDVTFLGSVVRIRFRCGESSTILAIDTFNDPNLNVPASGEHATISFSPEAVLVLDAPPVNTVEELIAEA